MSCYSCLNRADLIKVHDGTDSGAPTIAVLCNQGAEVEVLSTGSDLYVEFVANSKWPDQGFKAMFQFQPLDEAPHPGRLPMALFPNIMKIHRYKPSRILFYQFHLRFRHFRCPPVWIMNSSQLTAETPRNYRAFRITIAEVQPCFLRFQPFPEILHFSCANFRRLIHTRVSQFRQYCSRRSLIFEIFRNFVRVISNS